jgi:Na+/H+-translocating membrane pyrophosphatase
MDWPRGVLSFRAGLYPAPNQTGVPSMTTLWLIVLCGVLALVYAIWATTSVLSADPGNEKMQEIAAAIREGAQAYLRRQYTTIAIVGVVIFLIVSYFLGWLVGLGFAIGAILSGAAGFVGMNISVRANVRTARSAHSPAGLSSRFAQAPLPGFWWPVSRCSA